MVFHQILNRISKNSTCLYTSLRKYNILKLLKEPEIGNQVEMKGWIANVRKQKQQIFLDLNDGSTPEKLQVVVPSNLNINIKDLLPGSSVTLLGCLTLSPKGSVELFAKDLKILSKCSTEEGYPFAPRKQYPPEYLRQYFHLRPKTRKFSSLLRVRSAATFAFHSEFREEGFINVHTPILTSNDCEGAGEAFKVIPDNEDLLKKMAKPKTPNDEIFFDGKSYLTVSGQLHLEAIANGLGKVYTFGPTFRAENSKSRLHLSEFYMIEAEIPFLQEIKPLMNSVESLIKKVTSTLLENNLVDLHACQDLQKDELDWINKEFPVLSYEEALKIIEDHSSDFQETVDKTKGFKKEHEIFLVKHLGNVPTFIIDWPKDSKPFYMKEKNGDASKVSAFDLLAPGIGEIVGGSLREEDPIKLKEKIPNIENLNWYLEFRKFGGVPTGGFGIGFERYLQSVLKIDNIKDTIPFPRWPHNCSM
ncbi:probable asparagine--tRNA ligase, mitochondrial [Coccinella septempunctata]|uniref:probable asparagine--tRNA ligase, mitochondrial n=1 Tax=Coccinella septempunctata TaxID=41139 RepID=UPI001D06BFC0|nr:probable asparagine--tRNA ligase, mitochondrial [Coccinella septempunctata]